MKRIRRCDEDAASIVKTGFDIQICADGRWLHVYSKIDSNVVINVLEVAPSAKWFFVSYKRDAAKLRLSVAHDQEIKGGYEARKMDDIRARAGSDELFRVFASCTKAR